MFFEVLNLTYHVRELVPVPGVPKISLRLAKHAPAVGNRARFSMELLLNPIAAR
jgi:hypothetical protein